MKGHSKLHQTIELPGYSEIVGGGAEIFAAWTPAYDQISGEFLTDANGFDIMTRKVYNQVNAALFPASFFPVDSSITVEDF